VLQEVGMLLKSKLKDVESVRAFYQTWTEPGERIVPELGLYLDLYRGQKQGMNRDSLAKIALEFAKKIKSGRIKSIKAKEGNYTTDKNCRWEQIKNSGDTPDAYMSESQISRAIAIARKIIQNVEKGYFPGNYLS